MVACMQGLASTPWGVIWMTLRERAELVVTSCGCPLIPALAEGGGFTKWPISSRMASSWLQELLGKQGDPDLSTHSLKTTVLFWANAGGLLMEQRRQLGYHRTRETRVTELYGAIRSGCLSPDSARGARYPKGLKALRMALEFGAPSEDAGQVHEVEAQSSTDTSVEASEENHSESELRRHT
eukprot:6032760-Amphidinium_carterae.1